MTNDDDKPTTLGEIDASLVNHEFTIPESTYAELAEKLIAYAGEGARITFFVNGVERMSGVLRR
jgi:hypothetical protein